ncbi:hypothetical protein AA313_de0206422 [Arthrobotrys entomopaga]|nr:hypothetical protein AA313_de0206422 [Arthrobotrys entomopaga]
MDIDSTTATAARGGESSQEKEGLQSNKREENKGKDDATEFRECMKSPIGPKMPEPLDLFSILEYIKAKISNIESRPLHGPVALPLGSHPNTGDLDQTLKDLHDIVSKVIKLREYLTQEPEKSNAQAVSTQTGLATTFSPPSNELDTEKEQFLKPSAKEPGKDKPDSIDAQDITSFLDNVQNRKNRALVRAGMLEHGVAANEQQIARQKASDKNSYASNWTFKDGTEEGHQKRALKGDEDILPGSKRIKGNFKLHGGHLACPFAKANPAAHTECLTIGRKNLSGIKEHCKRNHYNNKLPDDIRAAKTWIDVFRCCNKDWDPDYYPSPYLDIANPLGSATPGIHETFVSNSTAPVLTYPTPTLAGSQANARVYPPQNTKVQGLEGIKAKGIGNITTTLTNPVFQQTQGSRVQPSGNSFYPDPAAIQGSVHSQGLGFGTVQPPPQMIPMDSPHWNLQNGNGMPNIYMDNEDITLSGFTDLDSENLAGSNFDPLSSQPDNSLMSYTLQQQINNQFNPYSMLSILAPDNSTLGGHLSYAPSQSPLSAPTIPMSRTFTSTPSETTTTIGLEPMKFYLYVSGPPVASTSEKPDDKVFVFEGYHGFCANFEIWMSKSFPDPKFSWDTMELDAHEQGYLLSGVEAVFTYIIQFCMKNSTMCAALRLVMKNDKGKDRAN